MPRSTLDRELRQVQDDVLILGSMVEKNIIASVEILRRRDREAAQRAGGGPARELRLPEVGAINPGSSATAPDRRIPLPRRFRDV